MSQKTEENDRDSQQLDETEAYMNEDQMAENHETELSQEAEEAETASEAQAKKSSESNESAPSAEEPSYYDQLIRLTADFENFKRRNQKEKSDLIRYGSQSLAAELLPILDNFERAVLHGKQAKDAQSIQQGIQMIHHQLLQTLERFGVRAEDAVGKTFDPNKHEAVSHVESEAHPENTVVEEHQKAYLLHDRLLRPAMVSVSKGSSEQGDESSPQADLDDENE